MKKITVLLVTTILSAALSSCGGKGEANRKADSRDQGKVLATVNGVPITEYDLKQLSRRVVHGEQVKPESSPVALETLVRNELVYQQALELGLDMNPEYRKKLNDIEAQVREFQRQQMEALFRDYVRSKAAVADSEAQDYFNRNSGKLQTTFHIWQIYYKGGEAEIVKAHKDIKSGIPFEKVAARRFPGLPRNMKAPWDLGYLHWSQIPPSWQDAIARLEPGQVSDIIKGPGERFWVIKLVGKTADPKITFATEKERIVEFLKARKADELQASMLARMRSKSKIAFPK